MTEVGESISKWESGVQGPTMENKKWDKRGRSLKLNEKRYLGNGKLQVEKTAIPGGFFLCSRPCDTISYEQKKIRWMS
jgi:hypothetical protein